VLRRFHARHWYDLSFALAKIGSTSLLPDLKRDILQSPCHAVTSDKSLYRTKRRAYCGAESRHPAKALTPIDTAPDGSEMNSPPAQPAQQNDGGQFPRQSAQSQ
jgi:hypothetical protein